jgi:hypothetical protein
VFLPIVCVIIPVAISFLLIALAGIPGRLLANSCVFFNFLFDGNLLFLLLENGALVLVN